MAINSDIEFGTLILIALGILGFITAVVCIFLAFKTSAQKERVEDKVKEIFSETGKDKRLLPKGGSGTSTVTESVAEMMKDKKNLGKAIFEKPGLVITKLGMKTLIEEYQEEIERLVKQIKDMKNMHECKQNLFDSFAAQSINGIEQLKRDKDVRDKQIEQLQEECERIRIEKNVKMDANMELADLFTKKQKHVDFLRDKITKAVGAIDEEMRLLLAYSHTPGTEDDAANVTASQGSAGQVRETHNGGGIEQGG